MIWGSNRTLVTLLRSWIRRFTMTISAWLLWTSSEFSGQEFEEIQKYIGSLKSAKLRISPNPKHEIVTLDFPTVSFWNCTVTEGSNMRYCFDKSWGYLMRIGKRHRFWTFSILDLWSRVYILGWGPTVASWVSAEILRAPILQKKLGSTTSPPPPPHWFLHDKNSFFTALISNFDYFVILVRK